MDNQTNTMVATSKTTSSSSSAPTLSTKATRTRKATVTAAAASPVLEAPRVEEPVAQLETTPQETTLAVETMRDRFERLIKSRADTIAELRREVQELRKMQRDHESALREASKKKKRVTREDGAPRKPSGFAIPVVVSDTLYDFLGQYGVKRGEPISRPEVTRHINAYIKQHDLQNPENRREVLPDATLKKIFGEARDRRDPNDPSSPFVYKYLQMQRLISSHFPKKQPASSS